MKRVDFFTPTTLARAGAELLLIVAGILIALAIDSGLTEREERAMARQSLQLVEEDLRLLVEQVEEFTIYNRVILEAAGRVEAGLAGAEVPRTAEFWDDVSLLGSRRTLRAPRAAWEELVGTGNLRLIADPELRRDLVRFYETLARDEEIVSRNNLVFSDGLGIATLSGEGIVLAPPSPEGLGEDLVYFRPSAERMAAAGIGYGPNFEGLLWSSRPGDADRLRTRAVAIQIAQAAANATIIGEEILGAARDLLLRIDDALEP